MADADVQNKVISKRNEGFPEWLDFEKLRLEGMDYLGELAGNLWTDHNTHDPGITTLEMLCYALLDLGYRTSLPAKDLFSRNPADTGDDDNFFTPAQILGCNPLTILDYRKLLVDTEGVKNAWLTVAEDITIEKICKKDWPPPEYYRIFAAVQQPSCINFLNGLYHVYLDIDDDIQNISDANKRQDEIKKVVERVKKSLMAHRNLCEDFYDITVLCKQKIGVCADIEIDGNADAGKIFLEIIEKLRDFISPSPRFYRLKQLLEEKGRSIEDIFAGRPFNLAESHGFIDTEEFENIVLRKEIHLSDIYDVIFKIEGITAIQNLRLQNCDGSLCSGQANSDWIFKVFENYVPQFSLDCSGFHFTRNGVEMIIDRAKYKEYLNLNFSNSGKTISRKTIDLDLPVPAGVYRDDLAEYFPLENDFPKVYGIAEGSLPGDVSTARKAQSLQLRGYLLFFDHLLSGYLAQLKNIRSLFSFQPGNGTHHTYHINSISNWPGLEKLLRFDLTENPSASFGNVQAFPVSRKKLEELVEARKIIDCDFEKDLDPFLFCSAAERDIAIGQVIGDMAFGTDAGNVIVTRNDCWFFYIFTSSSDFAIIGRGEYKTEQSARVALDAARFLAAEKKSYRPYISPDKNGFSFNISTGISGYWSYLQSLTENEKLYRERRTIFLDHLLARFAESFTDYALLSYSFLNDQELQKNEISYKENFLNAYPSLSSNRGKAYDYDINGWNNTNVSGFENKSQAYAGMGEGRQENLCHFEVAEYEEQSMVNFAPGQQLFFKSETSFDNRQEGKEALNNLLAALRDKANYEVVYSSLDNNYSIKATASGAVFSNPRTFLSNADAEKAIDQYHSLFSPAPLEKDIHPTQFRHDITIEKKTGGNTWKKRTPVIDRENILPVNPSLYAGFPDKKNWIPLQEEKMDEDIEIRSNPVNPAELINIRAFDHDANRVDVKDKTIIYRFTVNDLQKNFFFISEEEFTDKVVAEEALIRFLFLLTDPKNYTTEEKSAEEHYIKIEVDGAVKATNTVECKKNEETPAAIQSIIEYVNNQKYIVKTGSEPVQWRYDLRMGLPGTTEMVFTGSKEFDKYDTVLKNAASIITPSANYEIALNKKNQLEIKDPKHPETSVAVYKMEGDPGDPKKLETEANEWLSLKKTVVKINGNAKAPELEMMVVPDSISQQGNFGYRLVKKDHYHAWYSIDGDFTNKADRDNKIREIYKRYSAHHSFLEICYGGDIIRERKDPVTGIVGYHYQVKSRPHTYFPVPEMVLFESIAGYASPEEAQKAFEEQYVSVLTAAADLKNYGVLISFEEKRVNKTDCQAISNELVFIPGETMKLFGYNHQHAAESLSSLAATYPVKSIKKSDDLFAKYFLCEKEPAGQLEDCGCGYIHSSDKEKDVYYFSLAGPAGGQNSWISNTWFDTPQEALKQFYFFLILLQYKGNYHITYNECDCTWRLYLREILAISKKRFKTELEAWGREGVEKFICVSESKDPFHSFLAEDTCCYTFNVACSNTGLIHPCTYDTPEKRDKALEKLIRATRELVEQIKKNKQTWQSVPEEWQKLSGRKTNQRSPCDGAIDSVKEIMQYVWDKDDMAMHYPVGHEEHNALEEKKAGEVEKLKNFAHYFPVSRKRLDIPGSEIYKYYLDIKLPGFCDEDLKEPDSCGCGKENKDEPCSCCCTAWVSECCFDSCEEALRYFEKIASCLVERTNYYPVFDCECGPFGIRFYCKCDESKKPLKQQVNDPALSNRDDLQVYVREADHCCNEIVAYNPQCYTSPKMVCDAVKRARKLVNAEGLHLVEHILLRPHCADQDCNCPIPVCDELTSCRFEWKLPADDPCIKDKSWCFVPGLDPYSFIATAVLPAWPERFRKKENRELMQQLLYRELPSHIMLRILWLSPHDLCRFEGLYHNWTKWLAGKKVCGDHNPPCELIDFLFKRMDLQTGQVYTFDCFECEECTPCAETKSPPDFCGTVQEPGKDPNEYVNEINQLFCWPLICPGEQNTWNTQQNRSLLLHPIMKKLLLAGKKEETRNLEEIIDAERKIDQRFYNYKQEVGKLVEITGNINARSALSFLNSASPDFSGYEQVIEQIIANKRSEESARVLSIDQKRTLIQQVTGYYLDKLVLEERLVDDKSEIKELFRKLEKRELLPEYKKWEGAALRGIKPEIHLPEIKKLFD